MRLEVRLESPESGRRRARDNRDNRKRARHQSATRCALPHRSRSTSGTSRRRHPDLLAGGRWAVWSKVPHGRDGVRAGRSAHRVTPYEILLHSRVDQVGLAAGGGLSAPASCSRDFMSSFW